eukprot:9786533-Karenia_brevis.AAC.1
MKTWGQPHRKRLSMFSQLAENIQGLSKTSQLRPLRGHQSKISEPILQRRIEQSSRSRQL